MMTILFSAPPLISVLVLLCTTHFAAASTLLPDDEVEALREIGETLGKSDWDFNADPCGVDGGWGDNKDIDATSNAVTCQNFTDADNNSVPHVISIVLRNQSLPGSLPPQLFRLPYLKNFDFCSYKPIDWFNPEGTGKHIHTLGILSGALPPDLGNLSQLIQLQLTSNNFTGELPQRFAELTALQDLRLGDNQFTGKIPDFIQNFTNLSVLFIQASGLQGPIPSRITLLEKLTDLRISDLNGTESQVPRLNSANIKTL
ncbi:probable leucine-rich repeat receptor-like serine/threonine-protein kinase At3g14840 [Eucalyptus grandis]|uniref:probable leucine-rich repeat receptor-like serine/threonine-protein kinase At3g14840 n=1 Tax=Eucalyptus grandis TaxID=71139 RepID=UPI00192F0377|nr:probable leucine-rich repeat receptor-like serine/threonine-protein kinase At3g14840 [Eucalyptus grandis]